MLSLIAVILCSMAVVTTDSDLMRVVLSVLLVANAYIVYKNYIVPVNTKRSSV